MKINSFFIVFAWFALAAFGLQGQTCGGFAKNVDYLDLVFTQQGCYSCGSSVGFVSYLFETRQGASNVQLAVLDTNYSAPWWWSVSPWNSGLWAGSITIQKGRQTWYTSAAPTNIGPGSNPWSFAFFQSAALLSVNTSQDCNTYRGALLFLAHWKSWTPGVSGDTCFYKDTLRWEMCPIMDISWWGSSPQWGGTSESDPEVVAQYKVPFLAQGMTVLLLWYPDRQKYLVKKTIKIE